MSRSEKEVVEIESDASSEVDFENFKKGVEFSHNKLQELVYNDSKNKLTQENMSAPSPASSARPSKK